MIQIYSDMYLVDTDVPSLTDSCNSHGEHDFITCP